MLWFGLVARDTGVPASQRLQIKDEVLALDFDRAVSLRLLAYDNEKERANKKFWVALVSGSDAAADIFPDDDVLDAGFIGNDPYADSKTMVW